MSKFHSLSVSEVKQLTPNSVAISLSVPKELTQTFAFIPGQYITIIKEIKGKELRRAYSISSSPKNDTITIGVKKVNKGGFSDYANTELSKGDKLEVMPPEGRFIFQPGTVTKNILAFAAGSGITPIMSIARSVLESHSESKLVLVYGNKSYKDAMFYADLVKLQQEYSNRFFIYFVLSTTQEEDTLFGRIDASTVNYILNNKHKDLSFDDYYICGPESMIYKVKETLESHDVHEDNIHFELFTTDEISNELPENEDGTTALTIVLDDEEYTISMDRSALVLDAALNENIDAPYSCQGGVCSTCIARVTEGKAEMVKNQILTDSEIEEGFILTCQSHPITPTLKIDFDDV